MARGLAEGGLTNIIYKSGFLFLFNQKPDMEGSCGGGGGGPGASTMLMVSPE